MFEFIVALRFLKDGRMQSLLILTGIAIGVAVLIFLNALIGGLQVDLVNQTVGSSPHLVAGNKEQEPRSLLGKTGSEQVISFVGSAVDLEKPLRDWTNLQEQLTTTGNFTAVSPVVNGSGFMNLGDKSLPVVVKGFELEEADQIYDLRNRLVKGEFDTGRSAVLIGTELAEELNLSPGSIARLITPAGENIAVTVNGIFDLGTQAVNRSWIIISLAGAQTLYDLQGGITGIEMQVGDVFAAEGLARSLENRFPELNWSSWQEENANLLSALSSQSASSYLIQAFVLLAVAMGISSVLAVSVIQKSKQIGILKALGITTEGVGRIFLVQGALLGLGGSLAGSLLGWGLITLFLTFVRTETGEALFPITLGAEIFLFSVLIAVLAGMGAAALPARRAARLNTVEVIKNG